MEHLVHLQVEEAQGGGAHGWEGHKGGRGMGGRGTGGRGMMQYLFFHQHSLLVDFLHCKPFTCLLETYQMNRAVREEEVRGEG